ncbi:hypothetical protein [Roseomonas genomospecies 6]|uniref:Uncharacterized protein n=1 Tax=Roseomonas genomospecies 6 TaxID=214106 RepID=A0A9W7TZ11_9PROT|nr:hypothetical protein [Roseomonas genomospecies 6]KAA0680362.1 hypothetical protein DS843_13700 [Roseomonas genomospecies 6]
MPEAKSKSKRKRHSSILEIEVIRKRGADDVRAPNDAAPAQSIRLMGRTRPPPKSTLTEKQAKRKALKEARKQADDTRHAEKKVKDRERARAAAEADRIRRLEAAKRIEEYLALQSGSPASAVGPADESSPRPSPYSIRERERRAAYQAWLLKQQAGGAAPSTQAGDPALDGNAASPAPGTATSVPVTSDLPATDASPTSATSNAPVADVGAVVRGVEAPAEAAFSAVPYRGPRSLRDLVAGDLPAMPSTSAAAVVPKTKTPAAKQSTKPLNAPAPAAPGEVRAKRLADTVPTIIRVSADRQVLQRMPPSSGRRFSATVKRNASARCAR